MALLHKIIICSHSTSHQTICYDRLYPPILHLLPIILLLHPNFVPVNPLLHLNSIHLLLLVTLNHLINRLVIINPLPGITCFGFHLHLLSIPLLGHLNLLIDLDHHPCLTIKHPSNWADTS